MTTFYRRSSNITESSENVTSLRIHKTSGRGFWVRENMPQEFRSFLGVTHILTDCGIILHE